jgi:molybdopterin-guanine dinucleotide biosynthesis protein A
MIKFSVVIQAGGKSSRMGQDKALAPFMGSTLIEYILQQLEGFGDEQIIISNKSKDYKRFGIPVFQDIFPDTGALGGIYSGIFHASFEHSLILGCDMPFINLKFLKYIIKLALDFDAVIPRLKNEGFIEPFRSIYKKTCLESIEQSIRVGNRKVISFFDKVNIRFVESKEINKFDPKEITFFNVNTPEDLKKANLLAKNL